MKRTTMTFLLFCLAAVAIPAVPAQEVEQETIEGQVIQLRDRVRQQDGSLCTEAMVQTRDGEKLRVRLGLSGTCPGCVGEGDQVRLRLMSGGSIDGALLAREMRVRRTGQNYALRDQNGDLIRIRTTQQSGPRSAPSAARAGEGQPVSAAPTAAAGSGSGGAGRMRAGGGRSRR